MFSKRLSAQQCLAHPWLTRRPKSISKPREEETAEKKISTKKLRRFVIRRRWQVTTLRTSTIQIRHNKKLISLSLSLFRLESSERFISITTDGNDLVNQSFVFRK